MRGSSFVRVVTLVLSLFIWAAPAHAVGESVPAQIVNVGPSPDSVGFVTSSGVDNISARIGRWYCTRYFYQQRPATRGHGHVTLIYPFWKAEARNAALDGKEHFVCEVK